MSTEWKWYQLRVKHDAGFVHITTFAPSEESARRAVMAAERCPERAIRSVRIVKRPKH